MIIISGVHCLHFNARFSLSLLPAACGGFTTHLPLAVTFLPLRMSTVTPTFYNGHQRILPFIRTVGIVNRNTEHTVVTTIKKESVSYI